MDDDKTSSNAVLAGIRIIDLSNNVAGAFGSRFFAAWGADVIKVEPPAGDPTRFIEPRAAEGPDGGLLFAYLNASKRSIVIDTETSAGRQHLMRLLQSADLIVESSQPGTAMIAQIDFEALRREHPALVVCSVTPFGKTGPRASWKATALTAFASGGQMSLCGDDDKPPLKTAGDQAGYQGGLHVFAAAATALLAARRTGVGDHLDLSLQELQAACLEGFGPTALVRGSESARTGNQLRAIWGIYPCADGHVGVAAMARQSAAVWRCIGHPELVDDPAFGNILMHPESNPVAEVLIGDWTSTRTAREIYAEAGEHRAPFSLIAEPRDLLDSMALQMSGFWTEVDHPAIGRHTLAGMPFDLGTGAAAFSRAPMLGEHTSDVLAELRESARPASATTRLSAVPLPLLSGIRVLDLSQVWAGPYAARFLADMGADVIHVEGPAFPDAVRGVGLPGQDRGFDRSTYFNDYNRNKRGIVLELHDPAGLAAFRAMVAEADVVLENWSVGVAERLGIGYYDLRAINPRIVFCQMPAYGQTGPDADRVGFGPAIEQMGGLVALQGYEGGPPHKSGISYGDPNAGIIAAGAISLALLRRERDGVGSHIVLRQRDNLTTMVGEYMLAASIGLEVPTRIGNRDLQYAPHGAYRCADDSGRIQSDLVGNPIKEVNETWVAISVDSDDAWRSLTRIIDDNRLVNAQFSSAQGRREHQSLIDPVLAEWCRLRTAEAIADALQAEGISAVPVLSPLMLTRDEHLLARGFVQAYEHPLTGRCPTFAPAWKLADRPLGVIRPAPMFGQHNREVLQALAGLDAAAIDELERRGVIASTPVTA